MNHAPSAAFLRRSLFVTGTDTDAGKTFVTAAWARMLRRNNIDVGVMKPVASGVGDARSDAAPTEGDALPAGEDAVLLQRGAQTRDRIEQVAPQRFRAPLSPHVAAARDGRTVDMDCIMNAFAEQRAAHEVVLVEGVGGFLVPLIGRDEAADGRAITVADMAARMALSVLVVAANRLGALNHTLLTLEAITARGLACAGVVLTATSPEEDDAARTNRAALEAALPLDTPHLPIWSLPYLPPLPDPDAQLNTAADQLADDGR